MHQDDRAKALQDIALLESGSHLTEEELSFQIETVSKDSEDRIARLKIMGYFHSKYPFELSGLQIKNIAEHLLWFAEKEPGNVIVFSHAGLVIDLLKPETAVAIADMLENAWRNNPDIICILYNLLFQFWKPFPKRVLKIIDSLDYSTSGMAELEKYAAIIKGWALAEISSKIN